MEVTGQDLLGNSFWFHREEDEAFVGNLADKDQDRVMKAAKNYADFIGASTNMSMKSFRSYQGFNDASYGSLLGSKIAAEDLHALLNAPKFNPFSIAYIKSAISMHPLPLLLILYLMIATVYFVVVVFPAFYIQKNTGSCTVVDFNVFNVQCKETASVGQCVEQTVSLIVPFSNSLLVRANLLGFENFFIQGGSSRVSCAFNNCQDTDQVAEAFGNETLGSAIDCIYINRETSGLVSRFYQTELAVNKESGSDSENIVSTVKGPKGGKSGAILGLAIILGAWGFLLLITIAVYIRRWLIRNLPAQADLKNKSS